VSIPVDDLSIPAMNLRENLYFSPGISATAKNAKLSANDIVGITALWADVDIYHPIAHAAKNLPTTVEEAMALLPSHIPPSIIVHSGYGLQPWWLLKEAWYFDTAEEKQRAQELLARLQGYIRQQTEAKSWHLDNTSGIERIMRLPGTTNYKVPGEPVQAMVLEYSDIRYDPSELSDILPALEAIPIPNPGTRTRQSKFERRATDGPAIDMLTNCAFMQHFQTNVAELSYDEMLAGVSNLVRACDGIDVTHEILSNMEKYDQRITDRKIDECLNKMNPQGCTYIRQKLGFTGCPSDGCGGQAPCSWSLRTLPQVRATVRAVKLEATEVFTPEIIGALAILKKDDPNEFAKFKDKCKGKINQNDLNAALKKHNTDTRKTNLALAQPGDEPHMSDVLPDVPVDLVIPEGWKFNNEGVQCVEWHQDVCKLHRASHVPALISKRISNVDSNMEKVEITFRRGNVWRSVIVLRSVAFNARKLVDLTDCGLSVSSETARYLVKWFDDLEGQNMKSIPSHKAVTKLGWRGDKVFIPGAEGDFLIDMDDGAATEAIVGYRKTGDFEKWKEFAMKVREKPVARFILAAAFATPLLKILGQRTCIVHNWGNSQDGKTAALYVGLSVWGCPEDLRTTFNSTKTGLERKSALFCDLPMGLNERETARDRGQDFLQTLLYTLGEGKGRTRGTRTGLQQTVSWRTIFLTTGEDILTRDAPAGATTRTLELYGGPWPDDKPFSSSLYRLTEENHGHAGPEFVKRLIDTDREELKKHYAKLRKILGETYPDNLESHVDAVATIVLADYLASQWIFKMDETQADLEALNLANDILPKLVTKLESNDLERAWEFTKNWIAANNNRIELEYRDMHLSPAYGFKKEDTVYLYPVYFKEALQKAGFAPERIIRQLGESDKILSMVENGKRRYSVLHYFNKQTVRVIGIKCEFEVF